MTCQSSERVYNMVQNLVFRSQELSENPNPQHFLNNTAVQMRGVLRHKWDVSCNAMVAIVRGLPFFTAWIHIGGVLRSFYTAWAERKKVHMHTTTTERKYFGELFWPQRKTFQAGGGYKNPMIARKTISTIEIFPLLLPFFSAEESSALEQGGVCFLFPSLGVAEHCPESWAASIRHLM